MFKNLAELGRKRNWKEAFGFYISYVIFITLACALAGDIIAMLTGTNVGNFADGFSQGAQMNVALSAIACFALSLAILVAKKAMRFWVIILVFVATALSLFGGALLGTLIPAYFTTL